MALRVRRDLEGASGKRLTAGRREPAGRRRDGVGTNGIVAHHVNEGQRRRLWLGISVAVNIGLLGCGTALVVASAATYGFDVLASWRLLFIDVYGGAGYRFVKATVSNPTTTLPAQR